jgi:hypothetical protein
MVRNLSTIKYLQLEEWQQAGINNRIAALQTAENRLAEEQGRPPCTVVDFVGEQGQNGYFVCNTPDVIHINGSLINSDTPHQALETIAHEGRHAYQYHCINNPIQHPEVKIGQLNEWKSNFENYKTPEFDGYDKYFSQSIEVDARQYAAGIKNSMYVETATASLTQGQEVTSTGAVTNQPDLETVHTAYERTTASQASPSEANASWEQLESQMTNNSPPPPPPPPPPEEQQTLGRSY